MLRNKKITVKEWDPREWLESILREAIDRRASDVHIQPESDRLDVRVRIDGVLYLISSLKKNFQDGITMRLKVLAQMDVMERRLPRDGHFEYSYHDRVYHVRVATFPTFYGESATLRILNRGDSLIRLEQLGLDAAQHQAIRQLVTRPYGMVLTTGPNGSGKTTLLYSLLEGLNTSAKAIITIEDPIEFQLSGVRQLQVNEAIGLSFSTAIRAVLRQDPDILMVGEIRDAETADIAIQAALTGVLAFTTFHTLDTSGVVFRLIEMGIPRSVVAYAIAGIISTRLVRRVCESCRQPYRLSAAEKKVVPAEMSQDRLRKGKGCAACGQTGYFNRVGVFEVVTLDEDIRSAIIERTSFADLSGLFARKKVKSLWTAGLEKVSAGVTTLEEVIRVVGLPGSPRPADF